MSHAYYLQNLFNPEILTKTVNELSKQINKDKERLEIVGIAYTGISGSLAVAISFKTGLPLICIRKDISNSHSTHSVEFKEGLKGNCIVIDDLIASGDTIRRINDGLRKNGFSIKKIYLYNEDCINFKLTIFELLQKQKLDSLELFVFRYIPKSTTPVKTENRKYTLPDENMKCHLSENWNYLLEDDLKSGTNRIIKPKW